MLKSVAKTERSHHPDAGDYVQIWQINPDDQSLRSYTGLLDRAPQNSAEQEQLLPSNDVHCHSATTYRISGATEVIFDEHSLTPTELPANRDILFRHGGSIVMQQIEAPVATVVPDGQMQLQ